MNYWKNLIALTVLCMSPVMIGLWQISADNPQRAGNINEARIDTDAAEGENWMLNGRTFDEGHFSPLKQITDQNISGMGLAWYMDVDSAVGIVSEPIVVDGVAYISAPQSKVYAIEAATGKLIWKFDPKVRLDQALNGSYSARTNAGVAVWEERVFVGTGDCRLVAIDAATGEQLWEAKVCEPTQTGITNAPHVAKGKVFIGYNGSDDGVRGSIVAYDTRLEKNCGDSGRCLAIQRSHSNRLRCETLPQKPGLPATRGAWVAPMFGPQSPTIRSLIT